MSYNGDIRMRKDRDYLYAWARFCNRIKLKDYWNERTSYNWPFSCPMFREQNRPYKTFVKEWFRIDDLDLFFESENEDAGGHWVKHPISYTAKYNFHRRYDYLWFKRR